MPLIKRAIKKMYHDRRVTERNEKARGITKKAIKNYRRAPKKAGLTEVFSLIDKNVKTNVIHKNKAARLKSRLSKLIATAK